MTKNKLFIYFLKQKIRNEQIHKVTGDIQFELMLITESSTFVTYFGGG